MQCFQAANHICWQQLPLQPLWDLKQCYSPSPIHTTNPEFWLDVPSTSPSISNDPGLRGNCTGPLQPARWEVLDLCSTCNEAAWADQSQRFLCLLPWKSLVVHGIGGFLKRRICAGLLFNQSVLQHFHVSPFFILWLPCYCKWIHHPLHPPVYCPIHQHTQSFLYRKSILFLFLLLLLSL